jgi:hypothetical protein
MENFLRDVTQKEFLGELPDENTPNRENILKF